MSVNPFDPATFFLAKHAQHAVLIHFPIAAFIIGVALDALAQWTKRQSFAVAAYINLWVAAISTLPVIATGLAAWQWALEGQKLKGILRGHLVFALISTVLTWIVLIVHRRSHRDSSVPLPAYRFVLEVAGVLAVGVAGHLGGFLSGVNV